MICSFCKNGFVTQYNSQKYCSKGCKETANLISKKNWKENKKKELRSENKKVCFYCAIEFEAYFYNGNKQKFCSANCKTEHAKGKIERLPTKPIVCKFCNIDFLATRKDKKFCSNDCRMNYHKQNWRSDTQEERNSVKKSCPICDKEFTPKKTMKQIYCTRKCANSIQKRVYSMMSNCYNLTNSTKADHAHEVLGYSPSDLLEHLEKFSQWKSLRNQKWHLDHIFPIIAFVRKGITDISLICRLDNLQPLQGTVNCSKNDTYDEELFNEWLNTSSWRIK